MDNQKQQQLDVLIILDKSSESTPLAHDKTHASNRSFNDLCVRWASKLNSPNVIVAFVNQPEEIAVKFLTKWSTGFKQLQAFCVHNCQSLNDVLREIDSRQMLRNDFVLIQNCATFCSSYLARQIEKFKIQRRQNKKNVLTLLYYEKSEGRRIADEGQSLLGYHEQTQKLTHYEPIKKDGAVSIHKNAFLMGTIFRSDLTSCGIALCGIEFSGHFAGNYDFHTFDAIISDILSNEEILAQNIHVDFVDDFIRSSSTSPAEKKLFLGADVRDASSISLSTSLDNLLDELDQAENVKTDTDRSDPGDDVCQIEQSNSQSFIAEVIDSMQGTLEDASSSGQQKLSADLLNKIKLEINASKLAYNIPLDEVPNHLFSAFLRLPGVVDKFSNFTKMYNYWNGLWKIYYKTTAAQSQMLFAIEENTAISDRFRRILPNVLFFLSQDVKVLDDALIVDWYNSKLESKSPLKSEEKLAELVGWIQNAAEESSDTDEQDEEEGERRAMASDLREKEILKILQRKAPGTVAIFELKGFFRCYGDDVYILANDILMSHVAIQFVRIGSVDVPYHNMNSAQYSRIVKDLILILRYRVELYEEITPNKFSLKAKGVIGNLDDFEDIVSGSIELAELSTIMCVWLVDDDLSTENKMSLVFCNSQDMRIVTTELNDTPNFTLFEQCFASFQPSECLLIRQNARRAPNRFKKLESVIQRTQAQRNYLEEAEEDTNKCRDEVRRLFHKKFAELEFPPVVWATMRALLAHTQLLTDAQNEGAFAVMRYGQHGFMHLSNAALQALDIFAIGGEIDAFAAVSSSSATLHDHLNKCRSQPGKRLIREWMRQPLFNHRQIEERLDVVEILTTFTSIRQTLYNDYLRRIPDVKLLARKLVQKKAGLVDCFRLYQLIVLLNKMMALFKELDEEVDGKLISSLDELIRQPLHHSAIEFERFKALIEETLDFKYLKENGQYRIKPEIDDNLAMIATQIRELDTKAQRESDKMATRLKIEVKIESRIDVGFFFRITLKSEAAIRGLPNVHILDSTKGSGVRFQTKALGALNDEFRELSKMYEAGQAELSKAVLKTCAGYSNAFNVLADSIGVVDVLTSFAVVASSSATQYTRPKIIDKGSGVLELRECRHPVTEQLEGMQFIPNDLTMGKNAECGQFMILTGANMGGKSTYLKAAALTVLMGQMGSFVPCASATFSMIDGIYTRFFGSGKGKKQLQFSTNHSGVNVKTYFIRHTENSFISKNVN
ncbi:hypothetical protein GPALN_012605 [Globodera pallida]|nr:hypothetical protein GPALN_012605 [Globodera pallida]